MVRTEKELVQHQLRLHVDRDNEELLLQDKLLRLRLVNLKSFEKMFFGQKLKASCLKFSDKGTKFFHAMMSHKHRHNIIHAIRRSDGLMTTSWEEVGAEFVSFFQHSLGCSKDTIPVEASVVQSGKCLDEGTHSLLLAPVTNEEIRSTLFSIGNDKAPGPDGYSSYFFKKSWEVVGDDFCFAIRDFFSSGKLLKQVNHSIIALVPKSANVSSPSDFRPISCCNVIYKVISKLLAVRMATALQDIISPAQNAFLSGVCRITSISCRNCLGTMVGSGLRRDV